VTVLRIGTRRSALALAQAESVRAALGTFGVASELVAMTTSGDEGAPSTTSPAGVKGLFVDAIVDALEGGVIDLAVHSAKDLPAEDEEEIVIAAVPPRANPFDVLVLREAGSLRPRGAIGTSSLRRKAQLHRSFPGILVEDVRGNVDTRLRKLDEGVVDAVVLAAAGLARLGIERSHAKVLPLDQMVPAPGQGALAVQARADDEDAIAAVAAIDDRESRLMLETERSLMWRLGGGCTLPLGAYAELDSAGIHLVAIVCTPEGERVARADVTSDSAEGAAAAATKELLAHGAEEILAEVAREELPGAG
jgi:hydroxymethylbilane synthase